MALFKLIGKWLLTPKGIVTVLIAGLIAALGVNLIRVDNLKKEVKVWQDSTATWHTRADFAASNKDTIIIAGEYHVDTLPPQIITKIDTAKACTLKVVCPSYSGSVEFDTVKNFGPGSNPFGVRVAGKFYFPPGSGNYNQLVIDVLGQNTSGLDLRQRQGANVSILSVGGGCLFRPQGGPQALAWARYKRLSLLGSLDIDTKTPLGKAWSVGVGVDLWRPF